MNAIIEDGRGNRLVYKTSPLQQPKSRAAPLEAPPPPRERTLIMPLEELNAALGEATPKPKETEQPAKASPSGRSPWVYAAVAAMIVAAAVLAFAF